MSDTMRHHIKPTGHKIRALARTCAEGFRFKAPLSKEAEREAAARYWRMIGHDLPEEERIERHHKFATDAPTIRPLRRHSSA